MKHISRDKAVTAIRQYCVENIEDFEYQCEYAWDMIDKWRCPLNMILPSLDMEINDAMQEWAEENELTFDYLCEELGIETDDII